MKTDGYVSFKIPERFIVFLRPPLAFSTHTISYMTINRIFDVQN